MSKLLFIQYRPFGAVMNGGDQGTKKNLDMICRVLGQQNVDVFYLHSKAGRSSSLEYVKGALLMPFGYFLGLTPTKVQNIVQAAKEYDYVFIDRSMFGVVAKSLKEANYAGKIITSFQNVEVLYMDAKMPKRLPFRNVLINCADKNDRWSCAYSDTIVVLNERDKTELEVRYKRTAEFIIPVALEDRYTGSAETKTLTRERPLCLFLGTYFLANNEGILWFMEHVCPYVEIDIKIVGRGMAQLQQENPVLRDIEVISDAPDLRPYFEEADLMILPIFAGSGMKVKTCESLMYGKNILATDEALQGYEVKEGVSAWRCNTPEEFVACLNDFAQHPKPRFNQQARQCFLDHYSNAAVEKKFKELLN